MWIAAEPLRLILVSGSESRRDFVELIVTVKVDADLPLEHIHHTIRSLAEDGELEANALAIAHRLLDTEPSLGRAGVSISAPRWRHTSPQLVQRRGSELRSAHVEVTREGRGFVQASIGSFTVLSGANPPELRSVDLEWLYRKGAGISFRTAWAAVLRLLLGACVDKQNPQETADLILDEIEDIASVRIVVTQEGLRPAGKVFVPTGQLDRQTATASR